MGTYHIAQICKNGHVINTSADSFPEMNEEYCSKCGAATIMHCEDCGALIRGDYEEPDVFESFEYERPSFCYKCGSPYPWTKTALHAARELAQTLEGLDEKEVQELRKSLEDLVRETPRTKVAETRFKRIMKKVGSDGYQAMRDILISVVSEAVRKSLFGI